MSDPAAGLTPDEVQALLGHGPTASPALATAPPPGLRRIAAQAARRLAEAFSAGVGDPVRVAPAWSAVADPRELVTALPDPTCAFLLRPAHGHRADARRGSDGVTAVLELAPRLALAYAQRMLGGAARASDRLPSPGEWDVLTSAVERAAAGLTELLGYAPRVLGHETAPHLLGDLPAPCTVCAFEVLGRGLTGLVHLILPADQG